MHPALLSLALTVIGASPSAPDYDAVVVRTRALLAALIAANTSNPPGNEARAVKFGRARLKAAGIKYEVTEFAPGRQNLVARLEGDKSEKPLLLLAHTDVVGTDHQQWTSPPHKLVERDGYWMGRGVSDDLGRAAVALEVFLLLKQQKTKLRRDVILAWTGDEESGGLGIRWLLEHKKASIDAAIALNEGGGIVLDAEGRPKLLALGVAEKTYQDFVFTSAGTTGHSSVPLKDNALYKMADALQALAHLTFPARLLPVTRAYFAERSKLESAERAQAMQDVATSQGALPAAAVSTLEKDPALSATLRTTCVATVLQGGTRENALPSSARAVVNCRILPDEKPEDVQRTLEKITATSGVKVEAIKDFGQAEPSPLDGEGPAAIAAAAHALWPRLPIVPSMSRGASDSRYLRAAGIAAYGISPLANTEADARRAHGSDERVPAASVRPGIEFFHRLVLNLAEKR